TQNGKTVAVDKATTVCLTQAQLKDFLNVKGMGKGDSHSLKDKHLHVTMSEGQATTVLDGYYTDPNHAHGTTKTTVSATVDGKTQQFVTLNKFKGKHVSDTCTATAGN
ncbi:MAG: hypothetical protein L0H29_03620, partial [Sinobacteraceae bacterium]|nr:hypothetical protein [Nevskiaceae bacterium]